MERPHFFKAASRLGIRTCPNGSDEQNIGVEAAPDAILSSGFREIFPGRVNEYYFPIPEHHTDEEYKEQLIEHITGFKTHILHALHSTEKQIVIGGDHSVSLPSFLARLERNNDISDVGYIHFDVHPDINQHAESPTGNFHGEYLSPVLREFDIPEIDALVPAKLPPENMLMIGNLDPDTGEAAFINEVGITNINLLTLRLTPKKTLDSIKMFSDQFSALHVSFDIDVLDQSIAPATGIPGKNGFLLEDVIPMLQAVRKHPNISFDLVEVNPQKPGGEKTVRTAQRILAEVLR